MVSEGHQGYKHLGTGDIGGEFTLHKSGYSFTSTSIPVHPVFGQWLGEAWFVDGPYPGSGGPTNYLPDAPSESDLVRLGTTAIAHAAPTNPYKNVIDAVAQQIGQPIPGIIGHRIWKDKALTAKNAGEEYLNLQFGWLPLVSDIRETAKAIQNASAITKKFLAGSGKKTRVAFHFPEEISTTEWVGPHITYGGNGGGGYLGTTTIKKSVKTWFKGCFTYYVPDGDSLHEKMARAESIANHLVGARLTPEVVWDATPWTWAADWFANSGDLLRNADLFSHDGLVLQYGYIMQQTTVIVDHVVDIPGFGRSHTIRHGSWKVRRKATPFGFGVDLHALSGFQTSILVALGLAKGVPRHGN